jgi:pyruvate, orthophosphate dikinase
MSTQLLVPFTDGDRSMADLLGGKGANLAEMSRLGLPVPPGFIITTEACREFMANGSPPPALTDLVTDALGDLERRSGRTFGSSTDPLLVSVRSGARFSMPGMMETVLNVGLTDATLPGLVARGGDRFAWDCYRRLVQMYGHTVLGIDGSRFEDLLSKARAATGANDDAGLDAATLADLVGEFRSVLVSHAGEDLPQDPREQLDRAVNAVFASWDSPRARVYRAHERIPDDLGTAVNVVAMVYGNTGPRSGSGVCFTRNPATGKPGAYGDYLANAQGEDVVNGSRTTLPLSALAGMEPAAHGELLEHLQTLERHYRDLCDVEFTIEDSRLWVLQTRVGKRSPAAAFRIAADLADEGLISLDEALARADGHQLESLLHPRFDAAAGHEPLASGLPASPGASVGEAVFDPATAVVRAAEGRPCVLVRTETSPDDVDGIIAAVAVVTARGGLTSHAAVVARGLGRTCVTSVPGLEVDESQRVAVLADGHRIEEGDLLSVDGTSGHVYQGRLLVTPSPVYAALAGRAPASPAADDASTARAVQLLLGHADKVRHLRVRANAETAAEARDARALGAEGIGLCRTEHMLLGARRELVERVVVDDRRGEALAEIERLAVADFTDLLTAMDGLPVVVRLLDPPLHEFLPDLVELSVRVAAEGAKGLVEPALAARLAAVRRWHEQNPMLGLCGVRLLTVIPELVDAHVRALVSAAAQLRQQGRDPRPEIMVPLVADVAELALARRRVEVTLEQVAATRHTVTCPVGVMIELPRAALTAGALAAEAEFFSFGTNDLTQTTWGISRDDAEAGFLSSYREAGLLADDPFTRLDETGVGELIQIAVERGRAVRPDLGLGACGEHAGDPESIAFLGRAGLDYVSCSPPRVPVARLEAGRAAVSASATGDTR